MSGRQSSMEQLLWSRWTQLSSPGSAAATCVGVSGGRCGVSGQQLSVSVVEAALVFVDSSRMCCSQRRSWTQLSSPMAVSTVDQLPARVLVSVEAAVV